MHQNGNYALENLFDKPTDFVDYVLYNIYYFDPTWVKKLIDNRNVDMIHPVRMDQKQNFYSKNEFGNFVKVRKTSSKARVNSYKKRIKEKSSSKNLYILDNGDYIGVSIDPTGNRHIVDFIFHNSRKTISSFNSTHKNYIISHLQKNPNTPTKHFVTNVVIVPDFLDHYIDKGIEFNGISFRKIVMEILNRLYNLNDIYYHRVDLSIVEKEIIENLNFRKLQTI